MCKQLINEKDKLQHFIVVAAIMELLVTVFAFIVPLWANIVISSFIAIAIIFLKEYYDYKHPDTHSANKYDAYAGIIAVVCVDLQCILFFVLYKFFPIFVI